MDKVTLHQLTTRPNFLKDHNLKYLEFSVTIPENIGTLRAIVESLPQGNRKSQGNEILTNLYNYFTEVAKDYNALQEGSAARNLIEDMAGSLATKENEIKALTDLSQSLIQKLKNANA
jgi:hypothetical protein